MSVFTFISQLLPSTKKANIEDDIAYTKKIFDEVTIPLVAGAKECFALSKDNSNTYKTTIDKFYTITKMRKGVFFEDMALVVRNARQNLDTVEKMVKKELDEEVYNEAITVQKAHLLRASSAIASIGDLTIQMVNHLMKAEEIHHGADQEITKGEHEEYLGYVSKLFSLISQYGQEPKAVETKLKSLPEAIVTHKNSESIQAMFNTKADPFMGAEANGFIPHPVLFIREQWANFQISRYERNKSFKKQFELRVLSLKSAQSGQANAALEKQIQYYENLVEKLNDKIRVFESKHRGY